MRGVLRTVLASLVAFGLFVWWSSSTGRGFLPSQRRTIWLQAQHDSSGEWTFTQLAVGQQGDDDPPAPLSPDLLRFRVEEFSMGRTDMGKWSSWRANTWIVSSVGDSRGWNPWEDRTDLHTATLESALSKFVEASIIPSSPALEVWPEAPRNVTNDEGVWRVWQHRFSAGTLAFIVFVCVALGTGVSFVIVPPSRSTGAIPRGST